MCMVSIITPVYNASSEIGKYLDSVMQQTFQDLEVIIIDDHGTDASIELAHSILKDYSGQIAFRFLETPVNSGPGTARNMGIEAATGKYIAFVDSDDIIDPRFCELLVKSAERNGSDLCCCNLDVCDGHGNLSGTRRNPQIPDGEFTGEVRKKFLQNYVSYFTTYLYRKTLFDVNRIHFPNGRSSEDTAMLCCALLCCRRISTVDQSLYKYIRKENSLSGSANGNRYLHKLASLGSLMTKIREDGLYEADKDEIDFIYFKKGYMMSVFDYISTNKPARKSVLREIRAELVRLIPEYRQNPYLRKSFLFNTLDLMVHALPSVAILIIRVYMHRLNRSVI